MVPDGLDAFRPPWLEALGWAVWRDKQVTAGISLEVLVSFAALPSRQYHNMGKKTKSSSPPTEEERLAWVAMCIQRRLKKMMLDANSFLADSNGELRGNLTAGYVIDFNINWTAEISNSILGSSSRSQFRPLEDYTDYARTIERMVLALVRLINQPTERPRVYVPRTRRQDAAITAMRDFVYGTDLSVHADDDDDSYSQELDALLLELLEAVYYHQLLQTESIASVYDIVMVLLALNANGSFCKASFLTHVCAIQQYMIRATATHSLRLFTLGVNRYVPLSTATTLPDDGIIEDENDKFLT